jgi:Chaperone of endosialidase/Collagen triple helix repeat (20 copies)
LAYDSANNAANTVRVSTNTGSTQVKANGINFNNTATILVNLTAGVNGNANVSFTTTGSAQGPTGTQGTTGAQGVQGTTGTQGTQGTTGIQGTTGSQGVQGTTGLQGVQGTTGANGSNGSQGVQGTTGSQGVQGTTGLQGTQGVQGTTGIQGLTGTGIQGATGPSTAINASNDTSTAILYPVCVAATGSNQTPKVRTSATAFTFDASTCIVGAADFSATSDARLKEVIGAIEDPVKIINSINGVRYVWNSFANSLGIRDTCEHIGVLAQEVEVMLPELINEVNGYKRVSYDRLVPVLIEAIKELNRRIKILEGK